MKNDVNKKPFFYVVQFKKLPFEGIDGYVCVPNSWVILRRKTDQLAAVAYPKDENPFDTRDRVKKRERYSDLWNAYFALVKYESNSFKDAEFWIASRTNNDHLLVDESKTKDAQPNSKLKRKLRSTQKNCPSTSKEDKSEPTAKSCDNPRKPLMKMLTKRPASSESNKQPVKKRFKPDEDTNSIHAIDNHVDMEPRHSEKKLSTMAQVKQIMESDESKKSAAASGTEQKSQPQSSKQNDRQNCEQVKSMPIIAVDKSAEVITIDGDDRSRGEKQPSGTNINRQNQVPRDTSAASTTAPKPSISTGQDAQPSERNNQNQSLANENSSSSLQPKITDVQPIATVNNDELSRIDDALNNGQSTSHRVINSLEMSAELYNHMNGAPFLIPKGPPIERKMHFNIESNMFMQKPLNLIMYQTQDIPRVLETQTRNGDDLRAPPRCMSINSQEINCRPRINVGRSQNESAIDPKLVLDSIANVASALQNCSSSPQLRPSCVRILNEQQNSSAHEGSQQTACVRDVPQRPSGSQNIDRCCSIEEFLSGASAVQRQSNPATNQINNNVPRSLFNQYQPSNYDNSHLERQREATRRPAENNSSDHQPYTIKIRLPSVGHPPTNASNSLYRTLEFPRWRTEQPNHQDSQQQSAVATPKIPVGTSIKPKNTSSSSVTSKVSTSIKHALSTTHYSHQLNDQQSRANLSESAHENVYRNPYMEKQCVDKSTATNSTIRQVHFQEDTIRSPFAGGSSRVVNSACHTNEYAINEPLSPSHMDSSDSEDDLNGDIEMSSDEMLDETATDVDCTGSPIRNNSSDQPIAVQNSTSTNQDNLRFAAEQQMLNHFVILFSQMGSNLYQTAEMFKTLRSSILETAETYKKVLASVESFNNLKVPPVSEERQTGVTERENSGNGGQSSRRHNNLRRFVLPPEYDADDTRWTLKWDYHNPGLVELSPRSRIYVSYRQLQHIQQVSINCRAFALGLLPEIFSRRALSVCLSITEKAQSSKNDSLYVRPELDKRACAVLMKHVLEYGLQRGWDVDVQPILIAIHDKIMEIRSKYGVMITD